MKYATLLLGLAILMANIAMPALATPPAYSCGKIAVDIKYKYADGSYRFVPEEGRRERVYFMRIVENAEPAEVRPVWEPMPRRLFRLKNGELYYRGKRCTI
jgi:hypothetical protein